MTYISDILVLRVELVIVGEALRTGELSYRYYPVQLTSVSCMIYRKLMTGRTE
jgi:hypothetical protein